MVESINDCKKSFFYFCRIQYQKWDWTTEGILREKPVETY